MRAIYQRRPWTSPLVILSNIYHFDLFTHLLLQYKSKYVRMNFHFHYFQPIDWKQYAAERNIDHGAFDLFSSSMILRGEFVDYYCFWLPTSLNEICLKSNEHIQKIWKKTHVHFLSPESQSNLLCSGAHQ